MLLSLCLATKYIYTEYGDFHNFITFITEYKQLTKLDKTKIDNKKQVISKLNDLITKIDVMRDRPSSKLVDIYGNKRIGLSITEDENEAICRNLNDINAMLIDNTSSKRLRLAYELYSYMCVDTKETKYGLLDRDKDDKEYRYYDDYTINPWRDSLKLMYSLQIDEYKYKYIIEPNNNFKNVEIDLSKLINGMHIIFHPLVLQSLQKVAGRDEVVILAIDNSVKEKNKFPVIATKQNDLIYKFPANSITGHKLTIAAVPKDKFSQMLISQDYLVALNDGVYSSSTKEWIGWVFTPPGYKYELIDGVWVAVYQ